MDKEKLLKEIWNKLDYWCDQYKYANEVSHDIKELQRISNNIKNLENMYKTVKDLF